MANNLCLEGNNGCPVVQISLKTAENLAPVGEKTGQKTAGSESMNARKGIKT